MTVPDADANTSDASTSAPDPPEADVAPTVGDVDQGGKSPGRNHPFWKELVVLVVVALSLALLVKTFVVQAFFIPSASMQNTLLVGDKLLVSKVTYRLRPVHPGDIVVFNGAGSWDPPARRPSSSDPVAEFYDTALRPVVAAIAGLFNMAPSQTDYIKRVIGVPGDHVACCNAQGRITVNGVALHEHSYLYPGDQPGTAPGGYSGRFSLTVPPGRLWVLGDHRDDSADSRIHASDPGDGTIPETAVIGRAFVIVWPPSRLRVLPIPATFEQPGIVLPSAAGVALPFLPLAAGLAGATLAGVLWRRRRSRSRKG
ncbi:MAG: signal peptidase I [Streptosporangiaceae bacterium]